MYNSEWAAATVPAYLNQKQDKGFSVYTWDNVIDFVTSL